MHRLIPLLLLSLAPAVLAAPPASQRAVATPEALRALVLPTATAGPAAGKRDPKLECVAVVYTTPPAGIALSKAGRIFLTFPRWGDPVQFSLAELSTRDGTLIPFPSAEAHKPAHGEDHLGSVQGLDIDAEDHLWLLDAARARLYCYDLDSGKLLRRITFPPDVLKTGPYLNDVRVDLRRGTAGFAYVSDSARGGLIVVDLATGQSRRRLETHPSSHPDKDFVARVEDEPLLHRPPAGQPSPMRGNTDGIALSPDGHTLYYNAFSSHTLYAVPTDALTRPDVPEAGVAARVSKVADKPSANDGMNAGPDGRVYTTDYESTAIRRTDPTAPGASPEVLVQDARLLWPDAVWAHGGYLYITTNQLNRMAALHEGKDGRVQPYGIFRYPLP